MTGILHVADHLRIGAYTPVDHKRWNCHLYVTLMAFQSQTVDAFKVHACLVLKDLHTTYINGERQLCLLL